MAKEVAKKKQEKPQREKVPVRTVPAVPVFGTDIDRFFDRMFEEFRPLSWPHLWSPEGWPWKALRERLPAIDVYEEQDDIVVKADLPGVTKDDIEVNVTGSTLTIKGEKKKEEETKDQDFHRWERSYGSISRSVDLPAEVKSDQVKATLKDGVLEVRLPKTEHAKKQRVTVKVE